MYVNGETPFRADIEGLRAFAVLPIVLFHLDPAWCPAGFIGVDIFFVISGYLITKLILADGARFSLTSFYIRRFFRLFPALLVTVIATIVAAWRIVSPEAYVELAQSALAAVFAVSNIFFYANTDYFAGGAAHHPLLHTWSLGVEEQFYLLWPMLIMAALRRPRALSWALAIVGLISLAAMLLVRPADPDMTFYMMPFRIFEFACGGWLASQPFIERRTPHAAKAVAGVVGIAILAASLAWTDPRVAWPSILTLAPAAATLLLIVAGSGAVWGPALAVPPLRWIGRLSYALYLVHWPVVSLYRTLIVDDPTTADIALMALLSVIGAALLHYVVETPLRLTSRDNRDSRTGDRRQNSNVRVGGASALVVAALSLPLAVIAWQGAPSRIRLAQSAENALTFAGDLCDASKHICAFGDRDASDVVYLVGDSHALNLLYGLDELFRSNNIKGIALYDHGCLFVRGTATFVKGLRDDKCARRVEAAYALLERTTRPVIFAAAYSTYQGKVAATDQSAPLDQSKKAYFSWLARELTASLSSLRPADRPLIVMRETYQTGTDVAQCRRQPGVSIERCQPDGRHRAFSTARDADTALDAVKAALPALHLIDPKPVFCPTETCVVTSSGRLLFRDTAHLTNDGSQFVVRALRDAVLAALAIRPGKAKREPTSNPDIIDQR